MSGHEAGGSKILPAAEWPCNDSPFLEGEVGMDDSDVCWWCDRGRQRRENLFKECTAWTKEIRVLWKAVGEASGKRDGSRDPFKSRRGIGLRVRQARARPSNTSVRDLMSDDRFMEAVLAFIGSTRVGEMKEGFACT